MDVRLIPRQAEVWETRVGRAVRLQVRALDGKQVEGRARLEVLESNDHDIVGCAAAYRDFRGWRSVRILCQTSRELRIRRQVETDFVGTIRTQRYSFGDHREDGGDRQGCQLFVHLLFSFRFMGRLLPP